MRPMPAYCKPLGADVLIVGFVAVEGFDRGMKRNYFEAIYANRDGSLEFMPIQHFTLHPTTDWPVDFYQAEGDIAA